MHYTNSHYAYHDMAYINEKYTITILNDTNNPISIIWTAKFCGGTFTGRPSGHCSKPIIVLPGETATHTFSYTQGEGVLLNVSGLWCPFPLTPELAGVNLLVSRMLTLIYELIKKNGEGFCSKEPPTSWFSILNTIAFVWGGLIVFFGTVGNLLEFLQG